MRRAALAFVALAACMPSGIARMAGDRLGAHGKHLLFEGVTRIDDRDVYTFCRADTGWLSPHGDGACVSLVCLIDDDASGCR
ncbi:MAG TPA: hypothetical protein VGG28_21930 [Kofleriaceae bacterium]|jgi:hypothetical protein